jgi:hypothetical protein
MKIIETLEPFIIKNLLTNINLIIISPLGRGGSYFFQSLLNRHPEIITLPESTTSCHEDLNSIQDFVLKNEKSFDSTKAYFNNVEISNQINIDIDINRLVEIYHLLKNIHKPSNRKEAFLLYYLSYAILNNYDIKKLKFILIHIHNFRSEKHLFYSFIKDFPNTKIIVLTKDLKLTFKSISLIFEERYGGVFDDILISRIRKNLLEYETFKHLYNQFKKQIKIVDINLMHLQGKSKMQKLCDWLKIRYDDVLMISQIGNQEWFGNRADKIKSNGLHIDNYKVYKPGGELDSYQKNLINKSFEHIMNVFNYDKFVEVSTVSNNNFVKDFLKFKEFKATRSFKQKLKSIFKYTLLKSKVDSFRFENKYKIISDSYRNYRLERDSLI